MSEWLLTYRLHGPGMKFPLCAIWFLKDGDYRIGKAFVMPVASPYDSMWFVNDNTAYR